MDFGKVPQNSLGRVDFSLPSRDARPFPATGSGESLRFGLGAPVWNVKSWIGSLYPENAKAADFLHHYGRQFNSIELNTTHYRTPDAETVRRWSDAVPSEFRFNPKVLQEISHRQPLLANSPQAREFWRAALSFGDKLGICFLQLPPTFSKLDLNELRNFLLGVPRKLPLAIEFRHPSLFDKHRLIPELFDMLAKAEIHSVITDVAGRRDVLHMSLTSPKVLVRFIGNDAHSTDFTRLTAWIDRLKEWVANGVNEIEFFIHEPEDQASPRVFPVFAEELARKTGWDVPRPKLFERPEQLGLF